jgi:hypothetical protein
VGAGKTCFEPSGEHGNHCTLYVMLSLIQTTRLRPVQRADQDYARQISQLGLRPYEWSVFRIKYDRAKLAALSITSLCRFKPVSCLLSEGRRCKLGSSVRTVFQQANTRAYTIDTGGFVWLTAHGCILLVAGSRARVTGAFLLLANGCR